MDQRIPKTLSAALALAAEQAAKAEQLALENEKLQRRVRETHEVQVKAATLVRRALKVVADFNDLLSGSVAAETRYERDRDKVLRVIERGGRLGVARRELTRAFQRLGPDMREMILRDLMQAGRVGQRSSGREERYFFKH